MQNHLKRFLRDEEGSVVQTVLLAAGGVGMAIAVFATGSPLDIGAQGTAIGGDLIGDSNTLLGN